MANLDTQENRPLIESDPIRGGKRLKVGIEGQSVVIASGNVGATLSTATMRQAIGGFYVNSNGTSFATSTLDLSKTRDLGNSILGGGTTTVNTQYYPDGPDMLTIVVRNVGAAAGIVFGRLSWTEAQA